MSGRMSKSKSRSHRRRRHKKMRGSGIFDWVSRANGFLRKHKILSRVGSTFSGFHPLIGHASKVASTLGYGRKRHGGALKLAGAGLGLAGGRMLHQMKVR